MKKYLANMIILLALVGCNGQETLRPVELSKDAEAIAVAMKTVDSDKCALMYKQFAGLSEYMRQSGKTVDSTPKLFKLIDGFQTDYSYTKEGNKEYTDAVEAFLKSHGYLNPKKIVDTVSDAQKEVSRATVIADMQTLADAAKAALEKKNAK